jgi:hypothetical protein
MGVVQIVSELQVSAYRRVKTFAGATFRGSFASLFAITAVM